MSTEALRLLDAIRQLSLSDKLTLIELIFRDIKEETINRAEEEKRRRKAAERLLVDYQKDEELTAFTALDQEDFYEEK